MHDSRIGNSTGFRKYESAVENVLIRFLRPSPKFVPEQGRQLSATEHIYFAIRSVGAFGERHLLQYAFVDDRGNVVLSAFACGRGPAPRMAGTPAEDLAAEPLDPDTLEQLVLRLCGGAQLVAFHRVLQGGLLPPLGFQTAAGIDCAWRRFQRVAPSRGARLRRGEPLGLSECLAFAGLPQPASEDAALRALAIRSLWRWLDDADEGDA